MPNVINEMIVRELTDACRSAAGMLIVSMSGLSVAESEGLRDRLAEKGIRIRMVRNRLAKLALEANGIALDGDVLSGNVAFVWGDPEDAIQAAKVVARSEARKAGKVAFKGGLLEGNPLDAAQAGELALLPGKDELHARVLACLVGPQNKLVRLLHAPQGALARVIQAHLDERGGAEET